MYQVNCHERALYFKSTFFSSPNLQCSFFRFVPWITPPPHSTTKTIQQNQQLSNDRNGDATKLQFEIEALCSGVAKVHLCCSEYVKDTDFQVKSSLPETAVDFAEGDNVVLKVRLPEAVKAAEQGFAVAVALWYDEEEGEGKMAQVSYFNLNGDVLECARQCLWVGEELYCLEDIFGLEVAEEAGGEGAPSNPHEVQVDQDSTCVVCMTEEKDTTVMPCRHMCLCRECASHLRQATNKCPICRTAITSLLHLKKDESQSPASTPPPRPLEVDTPAQAAS